MAAVAMETRISRQNSKCSESNAIWQGGSLACIELDSGQKIFKMATVAMETRFIIIIFFFLVEFCPQLFS